MKAKPNNTKKTNVKKEATPNKIFIIRLVNEITNYTIKKDKKKMWKIKSWQREFIQTKQKKIVEK